MSLMKRNPTLTLMIAALLFVPYISTHIEVEAAISTHPNIEVERRVEIINGGILFMNDTYTLTAPIGMETTVSELWTGLRKSLIFERSSFQRWGSGVWEPIEPYEGDIGVFNGFVLRPSTQITLSAGESLRFRASYLFVNRVTGTQEKYTARIPVYPSIRRNISRFHFSLSLPMGSELIRASSEGNLTTGKLGNVPVVEYEDEDVSPFSDLNATIEYTPSPEDRQLFDVESLTRSITVRGGELHLEDTYTLINTGATLTRFNLELPSDVKNIKARDGVGPLGATTSESGGALMVTVTPRYAIRIWGRWVVTVSYTTPKEGHMTRTGGSTILTYPNSGFPHYIRDLRATVQRPESTPIELDYGTTLPSERPEIEAEVPPVSMVQTLKPSIIWMVIFGVIAAAVILRKRGEPEIPAPTVEVETPHLSEFLERQRERLGLYKQIEALEKEFEEEEIEKEVYDRRNVDLSRRINELTRVIQEKGRDLEVGPEISKHLRTIRGAENELNRIDEDLKNLEIRLRARRISRRDYERRRESRFKRWSQAVKRIEKALESMGG
ncbi:MAG: hypothetical protein PVJ38_08400 [Candidatus Bathyarchaeota archaeon]|jgi:hypothetical protein